MRLVFFGGKGGVGKTTCAAAFAVEAAGGGARVLLVSTDPAHSLGDALGVPLSSRVSVVGGLGRRLSAVELDAPRAFRRWLAAHREPLGAVIEHGTWLDGEDIQRVLGLPIPGVDELVALTEISRLADTAGAGRPGEARPYELVVVDTAPTGHVLRMLEAPTLVARLAHALDSMERDDRLIRERFAGVRGSSLVDGFIESVAREGRHVRALITDRHRTRFNWVLLPEVLSLAESEDGLAALGRAEIPIGDLIVNRALLNGQPCPLCDRRRAEQQRVLARIRRRLRGMGAVRFVPEVRREPRGPAALRSIGGYLTGRRRVDLAPGVVSGPLRVLPPPSSWIGQAAAPPEALSAVRGAELLLFGGKGGVGKTTVAAAAAVRVARAAPSRGVLLLSTDPAHSLGDVFGVPIGDAPRGRRVGPANLRVRELDAPRVFRAHRARLQAAIEEFGRRFGPSLMPAGPSGLDELLDIAPPGIDELLGVLSVMETLAAGFSRTAASRRILIVDTAPTGHALRLLQTPEVARRWLDVLLGLLLKYRQVVPPGALAKELVGLSKSVRRLHELLSNPTLARFIVVTRAAEAPRLETERLLTELRRLDLAVPAVVVNALTFTPGRCARCRAVAVDERRELARLARRLDRARSRPCAIVLAPLVSPPPRRVAALARWGAAWRRAPRRGPLAVNPRPGMILPR